MPDSTYPIVSVQPGAYIRHMAVVDSPALRQADSCGCQTLHGISQLNTPVHHLLVGQSETVRI